MYNSYERFRTDYNEAYRMDRDRGSPFAKGSAASAWRVYINSSMPGLGFHLFGRFTSSQNNVQDGLKLTKSILVTRKVPKKGFSGMLGFTSTYYNYVEEPTAMATNFGVVDNGNRRGSIQQVPDAEWNLIVNDSWLLGGVNRGLAFYAASTLNFENTFLNPHDHRDNRLGITGRELLGLIMAGYKAVNHPSLGTVMQCRDYEQAREFSLKDYAAAIDYIERGIGGSGRSVFHMMALRANIKLPN